MEQEDRDWRARSGPVVIVKKPTRKPRTKGGHGTLTLYTKGCRCFRCRNASREYSRLRNQRARDAKAQEQAGIEVRGGRARGAAGVGDAATSILVGVEGEHSDRWGSDSESAANEALRAAE